MQRNILRQVEHRLRDRGLRLTDARRAVVERLGDADGPRSAAELSADLDGEVPLSSLYRSLSVLEEAGVLAPHHGVRGLTRYELAEWLVGHHHHLVCTHCGLVEDVPIPTDLEARLDTLIGAVAGAAGFSPSDHALEIEGRCERCR
ncbi:MAG: Fur family transcriptional regulator [Acidimicrobiia bacterium]|nr:Fur family transcriptional regulator [Acidimicrobiia bacterium]